MIVATWNVNGIRSRLDFLLHWLEARKPDLVGLQELKVDDSSFPYREIHEAGYYVSAHAQKSWNGVAVLTREQGETLQRGLPGQDEFGARLLTFKLGSLVFTTVYAPNGKSVDHADFPRKLKWFDALVEYVGRMTSRHPEYLLCGDFNLCPQPIDSWNEEEFQGTLFHTEEERQRFGALRSHGLSDLFRETNPELQKFSWWDYRAGAFHRNMGLRIDLILGTATLADRVRRVYIDRDYRKKKDGLTASDHAPVIAELGI